MKNIVLGIMIASVSFSFAQSDDTPTHQLKNKFSAKQNMAVKPVAANVNDNAENGGSSDINVLSRRDVKSSIVQGVIRLERGTPFIILKTGLTERRLMPLNLPKSMAVNGQELQFSYIISETKMPKNSGPMTIVSIYDVSMSPRN